MGLFNWLKKGSENKKAEFVSPATGKNNSYRAGGR